MSSADPQQAMWKLSERELQSTEMARFMRWAGERHGRSFAGYEELWQWSVDELEEFWADIWEFCGVRASKSYERVLGSHEMPGTTWFAGAELNFAENLLSGHDPDEVAVLHTSELRELTGDHLGRAGRSVAEVAAGLREPGRRARATGWSPTCRTSPRPLVAFLAVRVASARCGPARAPEFGARSVIDRFAQIEPKVLLDDRRLPLRRQGLRPPRDRRAASRAELPSCRARSSCSATSTPAAGCGRRVRWTSCSAGRAPSSSFAQVPFDHPLWVLYSSGTTGLPKAIVHGPRRDPARAAQEARCTSTCGRATACSGSPRPAG